MNTVAPPHRARLAFPLLALLLVGRRADAVEPRIVNGVPTQQRPTTGVLLLRNASFSAFYGTSTNGRAAEGQTGPFFGLMFLQPDVNIKACCNPDGSPYIAKVPLSGDVAS